MARAFNGTTAYLSTSSFPGVAADSARTVSVLVRSSSIATRQTVFCEGSNATRARFALEIRDSKFEINYFSGRLSGAATTLLSDIWYQVVVTFSSETLAIYVNGVLDLTGSVALNTTASNWNLGRNYDNVLYLVGALAEYAKYSTALNSDQITSLGSHISPRHVGPMSRTIYLPLIVNVYDVRKAPITDNGPTTVFKHPRIYY